MVSSRPAVTSPSAMKYAVSVGVIAMVARRMMPVRPLPPTVAQKSSDSWPSGVSVRTSPEAVSSSMDSTWLPKLPALWWFLPWMSQAMAPPTVTCRVPGSTGTHRPNGSAARMSWSRFTPASTSTTWVSRSIEWIRFSADMSMTRPPPFCALSPYERPSPRAITPREPTLATASTISPGSGVDSTVATVGAVRAQPIRRLVVTVDIVTRVPPDPASSAEPEDDCPLNDEVDDGGGALGDDERHHDGGGGVVQEM